MGSADPRGGRIAGVMTNVLDPAFYVDPWQAYRWLRDQAPLYWDPVQKLWVISRYGDVLEVEKATGRYCSSEGSRPLVDQSEDMSMINMDDPGHQEQRRLVSRWFTPRAMRGRESHVRDIVTGILDAVAPLGQCEAIEAIASRLPAIMISDMLGYPRELWERVRYWSEQTMVLSGQTSPHGPPHVIHPGLDPHHLHPEPAVTPPATKRQSATPAGIVRMLPPSLRSSVRDQTRRAS